MANTTSHLTQGTCNTKTIEIEFEGRIIGFKSQTNTMYRSPSIFGPSLEWAYYVYFLRGYNELLQGGQTEYMTSQNVISLRLISKDVLIIEGELDNRESSEKKPPS